MSEAYVRRLDEIAFRVPKEVADLTLTRKRGKKPGQAFSDFVIHREQGDWAERIIADGLKGSLPSGFRVVKYGRSDDILAGEPGFDDFYDQYQDELDLIGKRPDILLFERTDSTPSSDDISTLDLAQLRPIVPSAFAGLEIRSSAFLQKQYRGARSSLSFTPKLEDLLVVLKWIRTFGVPHFYVQVFFDGAFAIPFQKILEILSDASNEGSRFTKGEHQRNQLKETIEIPLGEGQYLGDIDAPEHSSRLRPLPSGRQLYFVHFDGGEARITAEAVRWLQTEAEAAVG